MKLLNICCALLILTTINQSAFSGPLRDRIKERIAERQQAKEGNEAEEAGMATREKFDLPAGAVLKSDIAYGSDEAQRMDVYIPPNAQNAPVIFMVHGGGWKRGDKAMNRVVENKVKRWLPKGIIFVSTNYRMLPKADPLAQANDVALALAKAQSLAPSWGGDSNRFVIMGHSAGAHLVALISTTHSIVKQQGTQPWLGTVMLDSGGYDIEKTMTGRHMSLYDDAFGKDPKFWQSVSPSYQLTQKTVPMLAVCSTTRKDKPCIQAKAFADKAVLLGSQASTLPEAMSHGEINGELGLQSEYTDKVEAFIRLLGLPL
ncbi:MAG: alpha/beta hydrolase [Candidatus Methylopumilus sp.]|jgi:acetyl esterase/lipase